MSLPCPKCGRDVYKEEWKRSPPEVSFVYPCCGTRRTFYRDSLHGWESKKAKQKRLEVNVVCGHCKKPFTIPDVIKKKGKKRSTCDSCHAELQRINHQAKESYE